jgi:lysophospholipase L1-like esterase
MNRAFRTHRALALVAALAALAGCAKIKPIAAPGSSSGSASFAVYASLGTSVSAGWQSGGLVDRHQTRSFPALFAKQIGAAAFEQPLIGGNGLPALDSLIAIGPPLTIGKGSRVSGAPLNAALPTAYHHLAVPFAVLFDVTDTTQYLTPPYTGRDLMLQTIQRGRGSLLAQLATQVNPRPTFLTLEFGANELLGPTSQGSGTPLVPPAQWAALLHATLDALQGAFPGAKMAILTVPDVTTVPLVTTLPPLVLRQNGQPVSPPVAILGPGGVPLRYGRDYILLTGGPYLAGGFGYPIGTTSYLSGVPVPGTGIPLPDTLVLLEAEVASMRSAVAAYNAAIRSEAAARGFALVDLGGLLRQAATTGFVIGGTTYTSAFLTGGLFSLDGVHPNDLAQALICNELIAAVNRTFGAKVPLVNVTEVASYRADAAGRPRGEGAALPARVESAEYLATIFPWRSGAY